MLTKIISGAQTGADQGGLQAGKKLGLETGGHVPKGCMTELGYSVELLEAYGLEETSSYKYPPRTLLNVKNSDATLIMGNANSRGSLLTYRYCMQEDKWCSINPTKEQFMKLIRDEGIKVLNVAGNRESKNPGITQKTRDFIVEAIEQLRSESGL